MQETQCIQQTDRSKNPRHKQFPSPQASRLNRQQSLRKKRQKRALYLERALCFLVIATLLSLYIDTKIQLADLRRASAVQTDNSLLLQESVRSAPEEPVNNSGKELSVDYITKWDLEKIGKPAARSYWEILEKLSEFSQENELIASILDSPEDYPEKLLEALANNPEMASFVHGWPKAAKTAYGGLTKEETDESFPLFLQWDSRWGYAPYGDNSSIAVSGCGPVSLSMALYYLTKDDSLTPDKLASFSMENGYYVSGTGTAWALMTDVPPLYGINVSQPKIDAFEMLNQLSKGNMLIASMGPGDFTAAGHFVVIYGYDEKGFLINDPNCIARSQKSWSFDEIGSQIKNLWALGEIT